jgi:hypothetical protein
MPSFDLSQPFTGKASDIILAAGERTELIGVTDQGKDFIAHIQEIESEVQCLGSWRCRLPHGRFNNGFASSAARRGLIVTINR